MFIRCPDCCYFHYFVIKVNFLVSQGRRGNMRRYSHHKVKLGFVFVERSPFGSLFDMAFSCIREAVLFASEQTQFVQQTGRTP